VAQAQSATRRLKWKHLESLHGECAEARRPEGEIREGDEFYCQSDGKQRIHAVRRDMRIINPRRSDLFALLKELKS